MEGSTDGHIICMQVQAVDIEGAKLYDLRWSGCFDRGNGFLLEFLSQGSGLFLFVFAWIVGKPVNYLFALCFCLAVVDILLPSFFLFWFRGMHCMCQKFLSTATILLI